MQLRVLTIIGCLLISLLVGGIVGLWISLKRHSTLKRLSKQSVSQDFPLVRFNLYREYVRRSVLSPKMYKFTGGLLFYLAFITGTFIPPFTTDKDLSINLLNYAAYGFLGGLWLQDSISAAIFDTQALRAFQINRLHEFQFTSVTVYSKLLTTTLAPAFVALVPIPLLIIIALAFQLGYSFGIIPNIVRIDLLLLFTLLLLLSFDLFPYQYARLTAALQPIEETQWAEMVPRITAWASLAGVAFSSIQIAQDPIGKHNVRIVGRGQRPILIIGETLLHASEWRVQDALICMVLGNHMAGVATLLFKRNLCFLALLCAGISASFFMTLHPSTPLSLSIDIYLLILSSIAAVIIVFYPGKIHDKADNFAMRLNGDPTALAVAHHLIASLNGVELQWGTKYEGETEKRIEHIIVTGSQLWPRAHYASTLVPSILDVSFRGYQLTTPPHEVTQPAPMPNMPYAHAAS